MLQVVAVIYREYVTPSPAIVHAESAYGLRRGRDRNFASRCALPVRQYLAVMMALASASSGNLPQVTTD